MGDLNTDDFSELLSDVQVSVLGSRANGNGKVVYASQREIFENYKTLIPTAVVRKIVAKTATGDRSKVLWGLENALLECGLIPGEVVVLLEPSVWNKFSPDQSRLWADVTKADMARQSRTTQVRRKPKPQPYIELDRFLAQETRDPQWMIEGLWSDRSQGIIAGEPKTRKSYLAIDVALSVATGTRCLDTFEVHKPGPVYIVQDEISDPEMSKRLRYIATSKNLGGRVHVDEGAVSVTFPHSIPIFLENRSGFDLSSADHINDLGQRMLDLEIKLLIIDPLGMMIGTTDENRADQVRPILRALTKLKEVTGSSVMVVHHYAKANAQNPRTGGQRITGSWAFHGWVESALYLSKPDPYVSHIDREFRNHEPFPAFDVEYIGTDSYEVAVSFAEQKRKPPTEFEKFCMQRVGMALRAVAQEAGVDFRVAKGRIQRSAYLALKIVKPDASSGGRPTIIVVKGSMQKTP